MSRKLKSLREEISDLKLELLSEEEALQDNSIPIHGEFRAASSLASPTSTNFILKSPNSVRKNKNVTIDRVYNSDKENSSVLEQLAKSESALAARSAELYEAQKSFRDLNSQFVLQSNYYDNLYKTLSGEFVLAVKHISALESILKKNKIAVPPRPDLTQYDIKAPRLPAYMEPIIQEHAAQLVANASIAINEQLDDQFESDDTGTEVNQYFDPTAMLAQQMMQQQYAQQVMEQQMMAQQFGYGMTPEMMGQYNNMQYYNEEQNETDE